MLVKICTKDNLKEEKLVFELSYQSILPHQNVNFSLDERLVRKCVGRNKRKTFRQNINRIHFEFYDTLKYDLIIEQLRKCDTPNTSII